VFPEKLTFENNTYQILKSNPILELLCNARKDSVKKGSKALKSNLSSMVPPR